MRHGNETLHTLCACYNCAIVFNICDVMRVFAAVPNGVEKLWTLDPMGKQACCMRHAKKRSERESHRRLLDQSCGIVHLNNACPGSGRRSASTRPWPCPKKTPSSCIESVYPIDAIAGVIVVPRVRCFEHKHDINAAGSGALQLIFTTHRARLVKRPAHGPAPLSPSEPPAHQLLPHPLHVQHT